MIDQLLAQARRSPSATFLVAPGRTLTYGQATADARRLGSLLRRRGIRRLAIHAADSPEVVLLLAGCAAAGCEPCVLDHESTAGEIAALVSRLGIGTIVSDTVTALEGADVLQVDALVAESRGLAEDGDELSGSSRLLVLTTGTTGPAKAAVYEWSSLVAQVRQRPDLSGSRWLLAYHLDHFAGLQVLLHVTVNGATLVIPRSPRVADAIAAIVDGRADHVSATPTFWRFLLAETGIEGASRLPIRQITLGGEMVSQDLIDTLHRVFPAARISQVFATTEVGSCVAVGDLAAGLPATLFDRESARGVQMKVVDGELHVRTSHGMLGYVGEHQSGDASWRATGDLVERRGDRFHFVGRKHETINVGGAKVHPPSVEQLVQQVPGVVAVRCYGKPNPVTGQIVAVDVLPADPAQAETLEQRIREACGGLPRHAQPRLIRIVESLATANHKIMRRTP